MADNSEGEWESSYAKSLGCQIPMVGTGHKPDLLGVVRTDYDALKQSLLSSGSITSAACVNFFTDANPIVPDLSAAARAAYFRQFFPLANGSYSLVPLVSALSSQIPFDGPMSTLSEYQAGAFPASSLNKPLVRLC
jgi:hypothetical protein